MKTSRSSVMGWNLTSCTDVCFGIEPIHRQRHASARKEGATSSKSQYTPGSNCVRPLGLLYDEAILASPYSQAHISNTINRCNLTQEVTYYT
jgi:hypothetical protein